MGWSDEFVAEIAKPTCRPLFVFRPIDNPVGTWGNWPHQTPWCFTSGSITGLQDATPAISAVSVDGCDLTPRSWSSSVGGFGIDLAGVASIATLAGRATRGTFVEVLCGFAGWGIDRFERIAAGQLQNITVSGNRVHVQCRDLLMALSQRPTIASQQAALYYASVGTIPVATTVATTNYVAGAATLKVTSTTGFVKQNDGGGALLGVVRVTPNIGADFYLTYTGLTATTFTGCSATGKFGTTAANAPIGKAVAHIPYVDDHPIDWFRRTWASTGTPARNGTGDWLPADWALGLADRILDHDDMDRYKARSSPASGSADWTILALAAETDGLSHITGVLALGGWFPTMHQGRITVRCCLDPYGLGADVVAEITDDDIAINGIEEHQLWDSALSIEYNFVHTITPTSDATHAESLGSLPGEDSITYDAYAYTWTNGAAWNTALYARLGPWALRVPERVVVSLRGLSWARLSVGDLVEVTSRRLRGRLPSTWDGFDRRRVMITQVSPQWMGGSAQTRVSFAVLPDASEVAF